MRSAFILSLFCFFSLPVASSAEPIQAIIFDFSDVIATFDQELQVEFLATSCRTTREQAEEFLQKLREHEKMGGDQKSFLEQFGSSYPWNRFSDRFWRRQWSRANSIAFKEIPGMLDLVTALKKKGFKTPLFSNAMGGKEWEETVEKTGYLDYFKPLFFSYEIGAKKPDKKAFEYVLSKLNLSGSACLFIDDNLDNIESAKEVGMDAIHFKEPAQLLKELRNRGINVHVPSIRNLQHAS